MIVAVTTWCGHAKRRDHTLYTHPADTKSVGALHCDPATSKPPPPPPLALPVRPTFPKSASNFLLHAVKSQHKDICPLRCVMTFPVGLRLFRCVGIDQLKYVKLGLVKFKSALGFEENRGILKFWLYLSVLLVFAFLLHGGKKSVIKIKETNKCEYYHCSFLQLCEGPVWLYVEQGWTERRNQGVSLKRKLYCDGGVGKRVSSARF